MDAEFHVRWLKPDEREELQRLAKSRTGPTRLGERARLLLTLAEGKTIAEVSRIFRTTRMTVYNWIHRFNDEGITGLDDKPRPGRPPIYTADERAELLGIALTHPQKLGQPFCCWTLDRLKNYLYENKGIRMKRSRIDEVLLEEGLKWRKQETWFGERVDPDFAKKKAVIETLYTSPPERSCVVCIDELGPLAAKSFPGHELLFLYNSRGESNPEAPRANQEIDYGRRGKGYVFGALQPHSGEALTHCYPGRTTVAWLDFLHRVDESIPSSCNKVYAIVDNLKTHHARDALLFCLGHPRWEFVFQPKYAAYLNLIEPWWKTLKSLALAGHKFENWSEIIPSIEKATTYWNDHRHPFRWGQRRRHHPRRPPGVAAVPGVRGLMVTH